MWAVFEDLRLMSIALWNVLGDVMNAISHPAVVVLRKHLAALTWILNREWVLV
jgi:hypothetical protein